MRNTTRNLNQTLTTNTDSTTSEALWQEINAYFEAARKRYGEVRARWCSDAQISPISAIARAEGVVAAQAEHDIWLGVVTETEDHAPRVALARHLQYCRRHVRSFLDSTSTSPFANAVDRVQAETYLRQIEQMESLAKRYGV